MDVEAAEAIEPIQGEGQSSVDYPAMAPQLVAAVDASAGNAGSDAASMAGEPRAVGVISLVGMQLGRPVARGPRRPAVFQR